MLPGWVVWPAVLPAVWLLRRRGAADGAPGHAFAARAALALWACWLVSVTFFPLPVTAAALLAGRTASPGGGLHADLVPFGSIAQLLGLGWRWPAVRLLAGNVVVFMPFGLLVPVARAGLTSCRRVLLAAVCLSAAIELGQLAVSVAVGYSYRTTELDDVILNVTGAMIGFALGSAVRRRRPDRDVPSADTV